MTDEQLTEAIKEQTRWLAQEELDWIEHGDSCRSCECHEDPEESSHCGQCCPCQDCQNDRKESITA